MLQVGYDEGSFRAAHCDQVAFVNRTEFADYVHRASLVIAHGGAGTLIEVLRIGKVPLVMPRRSAYKEHVDDHQIELVQAMAADQRVIPIWEAHDLPSAILEGRQRVQVSQQANIPPRMMHEVEKAIIELLGKG